MQTHDLIIVGAGLSGIGAAYHIQDKCPHLDFTILEGRASMGGTWDLFKYPGVRSDSDMYTLGFSFYPWKDPKAIADGPSILSYIKETAAAFGIDKKIQYRQRVVGASWSSEDKRWTLEVRDEEGQHSRQLSCKYLFMCTGYYSYEKGHRPHFPGEETFQGPIIHPQHWDTSLDYEGKRVVIIGSGATAVTLLPEMAKKAAKVSMLQRTPSYIMNMPREDGFANTLKKILPQRSAHTASRWKNILLSLGFYQLSRKWPDFIRKLIQRGAEKQLGEKYEEKDFNPPYKPWDQRLCLVPDNDFFEAIREEGAEILTDHIETFTPEGLRLRSGKQVDTDIVIAATGLSMQLFGGMNLIVDGKEIILSEEHAYRGVMISNLPNFFVAVGYTNASWTLKCDLNCLFVTRLLNQMKEKGREVVVPRYDAQQLESEELIDLSSGYIRRAQDILPKQGSRFPWKVHQNYLKDLRALKYGRVEDGWLEWA